MTEALYKSSSDVPTFDTYPSNQPDRLLADSGTVNPMLLHSAEQIGAALGKTVSSLRTVRERLQEIGEQTAESAVTCLSEVANAAIARAQEWSQMAGTRVSELGEAIAEKAGQWGEQTKAGYYRARRRANQISRDYPVHVVAAAGVVGILVGVGMRIWRANRAH